MKYILLKEREIDILCISESWLLPNVQDRFINVPNFRIYRRDRGKGGGVCIYVRDDLQVTLLITNVPEHTHVEDLWLSIQYRKQPSVIIGSVYRHPHALVDSFKYILDIFRSIIYLSAANVTGSIFLKTATFTQMVSEPQLVLFTFLSPSDRSITWKGIVRISLIYVWYHNIILLEL